MTISLNIGNLSSRIVGHLPDEVNTTLDDLLSYRMNNAEFHPLVKKKKWDGYIRLYKKNKGQSYYSGLNSLVEATLNEYKIPFERKDERIIPAKNLNDLSFNPSNKYEARDYQKETIKLALQRSRGILKMATGAGKTTVVTELIGQIKTGPFMFYVLNKDLLDQAFDTLKTFLNIPIGRIGGGECDIQNINVCTIQTAVKAVALDGTKFDIKKYKYDEEDHWDEEDFTNDRLQNIKNLISATKGIYLDECHHASCTSVVDVMNASPHAYWRFAGSATPYREDGADIVIQALFGRKIVDVKASFLIKQGYLCKPTIIFEKFPQECEYHAYQSIYKHCVTENEVFNKHIADTANYLTENNLSTLILVQHKNQGEMIKKYLTDVEFITGDTPKSKRRDAINRLRTREKLCMIATTLADEGLDVPTLDAALLAGGGASSTRVNQRVGRTLRIDKKDPNHRTKSVVICYDHGVKYLKTHIAKVKKILKEEPEFILTNCKDPSFLRNEIAKCMDLSKPEQNLFDIMGIKE